MLLVFCGREDLIKAIGPGKVHRMVELGVWRGDFAAVCAEALAPRDYCLIDFWDYDKYEFVLPDSPQMRELRDIYGQYFGDDPRAALDQAYAGTAARFAAMPNIRVIRSEISEASKTFQDGSLDLIYLDANHTYEYVLRDLYDWFPKLAPGGLFICNDFFESENAARQNIGVIPAYTTFAKRFATYPIALTTEAWSDFVFSNAPTSPLIEWLLSQILCGAQPVLELPVSALPNFKHRMPRIAGKECRLIPSLEITPPAIWPGVSSRDVGS